MLLKSTGESDSFNVQENNDEHNNEKHETSYINTTQNKMRLKQNS